jgi:hypothetical protein
LVLLVLGTAAQAPHWVGAAPAHHAAARVTTFVRIALVGPVLAIEGALATANRALRAYCGHPDLGLTACADLTTHGGSLTGAQLRALLVQQARTLTATSTALTLLAAPPLAPLPEHQVTRLLEDLALGGVQLARVLGEMALAVPPDGPTTTGRLVLGALQASRVGYVLRVQSVLDLMTRAEGWLEAVDHETGAHATLPGLASGASSLESVLGLP